MAGPAATATAPVVGSKVHRVWLPAMATTTAASGSNHTTSHGEESVVHCAAPVNTTPGGTARAPSTTLSEPPTIAWRPLPASVRT